MPQVAISQATAMNLSSVDDRFHRRQRMPTCINGLDDKFNDFKLIVRREWLHIVVVIVTNYLTNVLYNKGDP